MCHSEWRKVIGMWWHLANYALTQHSYNLHVHVSLPRSFLRPAHRDTTRAFPSPSLESHRGRHPRIDPRTCRRRAAALGLPHQAPTPRDPRPPSPTALAPPGTLQRLAHHRLDRLHPLPRRPSQVTRPVLGRGTPTHPRDPRRPTHPARRVRRRPLDLGPEAPRRPGGLGGLGSRALAGPL